MLNLQRLAIFAAVVEAGSFTAAAAALGQTKAVVSFNVKQLENELGVSLLARSTRRLSLTDAGERLPAQPAAAAGGGKRAGRRATRSSRAERRAHHQHAGVRRAVVAPALAAFSRQHPRLRIQHVSSSYHADLISERFDVAIRPGQLADSSHRAALIDCFAIFPVAAPGCRATDSFADRAGAGAVDRPQPAQFTAQLAGGHAAARSGAVQVADAATLTGDSAAALLAFALHGAGVALLPAWLAQPEIDAGRLQRLLPDHRFPEQSIYALYPNTRHVPEKVRAFIDFLRVRVAANR